MIFSTPTPLWIELSCRRELDFHFFSVLQKVSKIRPKKGSKMVPKWTPNRENWCQQIACVFHRVWRWVLRGAPENSWGLKSTKPVPKSGQLVPKPAQPVPKAAQLVPKAAQLVPKAAQLVAKSANLIGLRKVSRPKVCPIFKTPDQPPKRPGMLSKWASPSPPRCSWFFL